MFEGFEPPTLLITTSEPLTPEWRKLERENERLNRDIERLRKELIEKSSDFAMGNSR